MEILNIILCVIGYGMLGICVLGALMLILWAICPDNGPGFGDE